MVVEPHPAPFDVGEVGDDVAVPDPDAPVLHVLGMGEQDVANPLSLPEQHGAHQAVPVTSGNQPHRALLSAVPVRRSLSIFTGRPSMADALSHHAGNAGSPAALCFRTGRLSVFGDLSAKVETAHHIRSRIGFDQP